MKFEVGKYYRHTSRKRMHVVGAVKTTLYGWCLVGEVHGQGTLQPVDQDETATTGWEEITEKEWLTAFS